MPKKRRSQPTQSSRPFREAKPDDAKISAINSWEDVADKEDHFHISRDKVSLNDVGLGRRDELEGDSEEEEEVMGLEKYGYNSDDENLDDLRDPTITTTPGAASDDNDSEEEEEQEVVEGWGTSKKAYYGGDEEEEYDPAEEEAEARRLQSEHLAKLSATDFLLDADSDDDWSKPTKAPTADVTAVSKRIESLPTVLPSEPAARLKLLQTRHPEFTPLSAEFLSLQEAFPALEMARAAGHSEAVEKKWRVASTYLGVLSMYFAVLTTTADSEEVKSHAVMDALLKLRQAWEEVKDERVERIEPRISAPLEDESRKRKLPEPSTAATITSRSSSTPDPADAPAPKKLKSRPTQDFSDLDALLTAPCPPPTKKFPASAHPENDFTEPTTLSLADAAEKSTRKRNLRFYTSQIVSRSAKRGAAGAAAGGDLDVPHKERRKERQLRLQTEAQRRRNEGADLDSRSPSPVAGGGGDQEDDEYYQLLASTAAKRKEQKKAVYEAQKKGGVVRVEEGKAVDGKRAIGYTIEKNKGLTPHRKKDVRNPRVKKRNAYEKKKKKLSSVKAVYKGGQKGAYGGELTGIKKNLVKSVKFNS